MAYDDAARALFQVPHGEFVAERKRLAAELKAAGDKMGASRISRLQRPPVTAWAVNQLYWHARDAVDALFDLAARLRAGDLSATTAHREAVAKLRNRAAAMLGDAGHGANEATLRRVALTLSAVAAAGTWMPDSPGQLSADRDPPGFDAVGVINAPAAALPDKSEPVKYDFDAPISPIVVAATPPPAPAAPKRNAVAELAAKRKAMAEEEKRRKAAEKRGEVYVPLSEETEMPVAPVASAPVSVSPSASVKPIASASATLAPIASVTPIVSAKSGTSVVPTAPVNNSDEDGSEDDEEEVIEPPPRPRTLSLVPLPTEEESDDSDDSDDDDDSEDDSDDKSDGDDNDDIDTAAASDEADNESDDESDEESDDNADEVEAPAPAKPKLSALELLRLRKKQHAEEAEEERRRKFMEDGGTKDRVIAKRMMEAQERNREASDTKRERVESAVRAKVDAQRTSADAQRASVEAHRVTHESDDDDSDDDDDLDDESAPTLTVQPGGRADSPSKGPPQATDLVSALAAKLGAKPPDPTKLSTGASPARGAPSTPSTGASPVRPGSQSDLSTGASPARGGEESPRAAGPKLSTGASPARHVPENTKPPGTFPRPRTPSAESLVTPTKASSATAKPGPMTDAERRKIDARAKLKAELEARMRAANADVATAEQRVEKLTAELADADDALEAARAVVEDLREKLDALD